ncbi:MAG: N-acetylmuramoyl-L-alanine amidase [Candidatus Promineifilaceae bacterium]
MNSPYDNHEWGTADDSWLSAFGRVIPFFLFFLLVGAGLAAVYLFFSPADGQAEVVAAVRSSGLSAPFSKPVPPEPVVQRMAQSPAPLRIAIISGHRGNDAGAVCEDGLTEEEVNFAIAQRVVEDLRGFGIRTALFDEFDERLYGYSGTALISIHADSCEYYHDEATGYKIAGSYMTDSTMLENCVNQSYSSRTHLSYHANTITPHMTDYHAFREIGIGTPAIIIETGFMNLDREILTTENGIPAQAITEGILCYVSHVRGDVTDALAGSSS